MKGSIITGDGVSLSYSIEGTAMAEVVMLLHSKIPDARVVSLPAAHLSNLEQPEAFTRALLAFFTHEA
jgi:pimeloyl-ACP methyl ester carboxylesterase